MSEYRSTKQASLIRDQQGTSVKCQQTCNAQQGYVTHTAHTETALQPQAAITCKPIKRCSRDLHLEDFNQQQSLTASLSVGMQGSRFRHT